MSFKILVLLFLVLTSCSTAKLIYKTTEAETTYEVKKGCFSGVDYFEITSVNRTKDTTIRYLYGYRCNDSTFTDFHVRMYIPDNSRSIRGYTSHTGDIYVLSFDTLPFKFSDTLAFPTIIRKMLIKSLTESDMPCKEMRIKEVKSIIGLAIKKEDEEED